jgi:hypothetical protein
MNKKIQILLFYIFLILLFMGISFVFSKEDDKMINCLGSAIIAIGISILLWQNYGRNM